MLHSGQGASERYSREGAQGMTVAFARHVPQMPYFLHVVLRRQPWEGCLITTILQVRFSGTREGR